MNPKELEALVQSHGTHLVKRLLTISRSRNHTKALAAIKALMSYGYGVAGHSGRDPWEGVESNDAFVHAVQAAMKQGEVQHKKAHVLKIVKKGAAQ